MNPQRTSRLILYSLFIIAFLLMIVLANMPTSHGKVAWSLMTGWIDFIRDVLLHARIYWPSIITGIVCAFIVIIGVQTTGTWWLRARSETEAISTEPGNAAVPAALNRWRFRWSLGLVFLIVMLFAAGIVIVALFHQISWLSSDLISGEAFTEIPGRRRW